MMNTVERRGVIVGFANGLARVRMEIEPACTSCGSRSSCSTAKTQVVELSLSHAAKVGDQVAVVMPAESITRAALIGYLLPPTSLLLGAWLAGFAYPGDAAAVLGAGLGFVAGLLAVRFIAKHFKGQGFVPSVCASDETGGINVDQSKRLQPGDYL